MRSRFWRRAARSAWSAARPRGSNFRSTWSTSCGGRTVRGIIEGDANPDVFLPKLVDLFVKGKFPIDRLVTFYPFARINDAIADALCGKVVKPILRF